jgi:uncharacterized protein (TIGR02246 family)
MNRVTLMLFMLALGVFVCTGCRRDEPLDQPPPTDEANMDTRREDVEAIRQLERRAREAAEAKDVDRYVSFYADDAVLFWPGAPMVRGQTAIREFMQAFLSMPAFSLSFETAEVDVSRAGDLAYSYGTNRVSLVGPNGKRMQDRGKYLTVYRKQPDGTWKVVADIGNSDLPAPVPDSTPGVKQP